MIGVIRGQKNPSIDRGSELTGNRGLSRHVESFVRFYDNVIDDCFHILRAFPYGELPVGAGAFAHDPLDVRHLLLSTEVIYLGRDKLEQFV
jgi:hypothetical protein